VLCESVRGDSRDFHDQLPEWDQFERELREQEWSTLRKCEKELDAEQSTQRAR